MKKNIGYTHKCPFNFVRLCQIHFKLKSIPLVGLLQASLSKEVISTMTKTMAMTKKGVKNAFVYSFTRLHRHHDRD